MRRKVGMFLILMYRERQSRSIALSPQNTAFILHCYSLRLRGPPREQLEAGFSTHFTCGVCLLFPSPW